MSITPNKCQMGTNHEGEATLDTLVIPTNGAADVDIATVDGTIRRRLLSCTYASNAWTLTFRPNTLQPSPFMSIDCELKIGTSTFVDVAVAAIDTTAQTLTINFATAAGVATPPPAAATGAELHLVLFRMNPT